MTNTDTQSVSKKTPDFSVHVKVKNGDKSKVGAQIGTGWLHSEGQGLNIVLQAQPIPDYKSGQINLVCFKIDT